MGFVPLASWRPSTYKAGDLWHVWHLSTLTLSVFLAFFSVHTFFFNYIFTMSQAAETSSIHSFTSPIDEDYDCCDDTSEYIVPPQGAYLAFTVDLERTFQTYQFPIDDLAAEWLKEFPKRTYVGYVSHVSLWCLLSFQYAKYFSVL